MKLKNRLAATLAGIGLAASVGLATAPTASAGACVDSMWRINSRGECVKAIQALANLKYNPDVAVDGVFGPKTDAAVRSVQRGWGVKVDGIVGRQTWSVLCSPMAWDTTNPGYVPPQYPIYWARVAGCPGAWEYHY